VSRVPAFPVYLFDVDGTLLDSAPDICGAIQAVLQTTPAGSVPDSFLRRYIGRHLIDLFGDLFPAYSPEQIDRLVVEYRAIYPRRGHRSTKPFPNVVETVAELGGRKSTARPRARQRRARCWKCSGWLRISTISKARTDFPPSLLRT
jgi:phosphoglycolate phosphatase-like HAD superfamily hydrolase